MSDATEHPPDSLDVSSPILIADRLVQFLFQQTPDSLRRGDLLIRPGGRRVHQSQLSPDAVDRLLDIGAAAADTMLPRLRCPGAPAPRPQPGMPTRVGDHLHRRRQRLGAARSHPAARPRGPGDTLDVLASFARVRNLAAASEAYQSVWLGPSGRGDTVDFSLVLHRAARRVAGIGLAYDNELGGRMWAGLVDRRLFGRALEGSGAVVSRRAPARALRRRAAELPARPPASQSRRDGAHRRGGDPPVRSRRGRAARGQDPRGDRIRGRGAAASARMAARGGFRGPRLARVRPGRPVHARHPRSATARQPVTRARW